MLEIDNFNLVKCGTTAFLAEDSYIYRKDIAVIENYSGKYKLTLYKSLREAGWQEVKPDNYARVWRGVERRSTVEKESKMKQSISRSRRMIFEYSMCKDIF